MKKTLLKLTQDILDAIDGDAVNSISDTVESLQVARLIVNTYYELFASKVNPSAGDLIELQSLADPDRPHVMMIPDNVKCIKWIKYDGEDVTFQEPEDFLISQLAVSDYNVGKYDIYSDRNPTYWTTFDNKHIVFNAINNDVDSVLQQSKTVCWGQYVPVYDMDDNAYAPYLDSDQYPMLLAEATATAFVQIKQVSNAKEEQKSRRQRVRNQNDEWRANQRRPYDRSVDYGSRTRYRGPR